MNAPCKKCGRSFTPLRRSPLQRYCPECLQLNKAVLPIVYRWVAPDGRSYVGSAWRGNNRDAYGLARTNPRIDAALLQYPSVTWTYEIIERLDPRCSMQELRVAEQKHIDGLRSWMPEYGFNIAPASWETISPEHYTQFCEGAKRAQAESAERWRLYWAERESAEQGDRQ